MNNGTLSGIINGEFKEVGSGDYVGVRFPVEVALNPKKPDVKETYQVVAYAANAELLKEKAKTGSRVNLDYRLGSDKIADKQYDTVLIVNKVLGVLTDASLGMDSISIVVGGSAKFRKFNTTPSGASVLNALITITKEFNGKKSTVYTDAAIWNALAEANAGRAETETEVVILGTPRPKVIPADKEHPEKLKMDVWANAVIFAGEGGSDAPPGDSADEAPAQPAETTGTRRYRAGARTSTSDDITF